MVVIKEVKAKSIRDSRGDKTIFIEIVTNVGKFSSSAPNGKSTGKFEAKPYKKSLESDIKNLYEISEYFSEEIIESFDDLRRVEDIVDGHIGANSLFALESCILKALAKENNKEIWQIINSNAKDFPRLVGNCVGGGLHSHVDGKKPDFQEFLLIPDLGSVKKNYQANKNAKIKIGEKLKQIDKNFDFKKNDEQAWVVSLNEKQIFDILKETGFDLGTDVAASGFYKRKYYNYNNPMLKRTLEEQSGYLKNLIKNFNLLYVEDAFYEEDFENFADLLKSCPNSLIVGDDLIVTNLKRLKKAIKNKSVNAIIVKPNQCGSLLEVKRVCELAKENNIKLVFSHRSGETKETILADLAFGFGADFFKCGIDGDVREFKIKRLVEIEEGME